MSQEYKMTATEREKQRQRMALYRAKKRAEKAAGVTTTPRRSAASKVATKKKNRVQKEVPFTPDNSAEVTPNYAAEIEPEEEGSTAAALAIIGAGVAILAGIMAIPFWLARNAQ